MDSREAPSRSIDHSTGVDLAFFPVLLEEGDRVDLVFSVLVFLGDVHLEFDVESGAVGDLDEAVLDGS
jgi:hypothetical protein